MENCFAFSLWSKLIQQVPHGSVLGQIWINIYLNDLFFYVNGIIFNFADDAIPCVCDISLNLVFKKLEEQANVAMRWFGNNFMKINSDSYELFISVNKSEQV